MHTTSRLVSLIAILAVVTLSSVGLAVWLLYQAALDEERAQLVETVRSQAHLIAAVARFDRRHAEMEAEPEGAYKEGALAATLSQVEDALGQSGGLGQTGEFVLGQQRQGQIAILLRQRRAGPEQLVEVPQAGLSGEPVRRAIAGKSGWMVGRDYRGEEVLAAYEPVADTPWGLVAKRDMDEIQAPYIRQGAIASGVGIALVLLGAGLFHGITNPVLHRLRESERRYRELFEAADEAIIVTDAHDRVALANRRAGEIFHWDPSAGIGRPVQSFFAGTETQDIERRLEERHRGKRETYEWSFQRDGQTIWIRVTGTPLFDESGHYRGSLALISDITARREAERSAREREDLLQQVLDTLPVGVWVLDAHMQCLLHNPAAEAIWGSAGEGAVEICGAYRAWWHDSGEAIAAQEGAIHRAIHQGETSSEEVIDIEAFDGTRKTILNWAVPLRASEGAISGAIIVNQDITRRQALERHLQRNEAFLNTIVRGLPIGVWVTDESGSFVLWNPAGEAIWAGSPNQGGGDLTGFKAWWPETGEPVAPDAWAMRRARERDETVLDEVVEIEAFDGTRKTIRQSAVPLHDADGKTRGAVVAARDITAERQAEARMRTLSNAFLQTADLVCIVDAHAHLESVNPAFEQVTGYSLDDVHGLRLRSVLTDASQTGDFYERMWRQVSKGETFRDVLATHTRGQALLVCEVTMTPVHDERGVIHSFVATARDMTRQHELQERLYHLARHDALTDLPNRTELESLIRDAMPRALSRQSQVGLLFINLDDFKTINDSLGHQAGDEILKEMARRLREAATTGETPARLGGDSFALLIEDAEDPDQASTRAQAMLELCLDRPFQTADQEVPVSASIGIALAPPDGRDAPALLRNAEAAMYRAKQAGRNQYQFYAHELTVRSHERLAMTREIRRALDAEQFELHYQPQIHLASGELRGLEALIRWRHPERGLVPPEQFIPLAEDTGQILAIGDWALRQSLSQIRAWRRAGASPPRVGVNLSARQFADPQLSRKLSEALADSGLQPEVLELEITESVLMEDAEAVTERVRALHDLGIGLAVDDFGTGYSSLAYLSRFRVHTLKIDRSFVADLSLGPGAASIVDAVISLAHGLGLEVVAEGVEAQAQLDYLHSQGCDSVQGFYTGRPVPPGELGGLLAQWAQAPGSAAG